MVHRRAIAFLDPARRIPGVIARLAKKKKRSPIIIPRAQPAGNSSILTNPPVAVLESRSGHSRGKDCGVMWMVDLSGRGAK